MNKKEIKQLRVDVCNSVNRLNTTINILPPNVKLSVMAFSLMSNMNVLLIDGDRGRDRYIADVLSKHIKLPFINGVMLNDPYKLGIPLTDVNVPIKYNFQSIVNRSNAGDELTYIIPYPLKYSKCVAATVMGTKPAKQHKLINRATYAEYLIWYSETLSEINLLMDYIVKTNCNDVILKTLTALMVSNVDNVRMNNSQIMAMELHTLESEACEKFYIDVSYDQDDYVKKYPTSLRFCITDLVLYTTRVDIDRLETNVRSELEQMGV